MRDAPHARCRGDFAKRQRVHRRIQAAELHDVENVCWPELATPASVIPNLNGLAQRHVQRKLPRTFNDVPAGIAERRAVRIHARAGRTSPQQNAAVLNHSSEVGLLSEMDCPAT